MLKLEPPLSGVVLIFFPDDHGLGLVLVANGTSDLARSGGVSCTCLLRG